MNHIHRIVWSRARRAFVVTHERARSAGKAAGQSGRSAVRSVVRSVVHSFGALVRHRLLPLAVWLGLAFAPSAFANPTLPQVVHGSAGFSSVGSTLTVNNSNNAIINWQSFSIGQGETTRFVQPDAASRVLNRVVGASPSQLLGNLTSNGQVFLVNPAGVLVGPGASIDVASFVASTLNLSNDDFLAGRLNFSGSAAGAVSNHGHIQSGLGGSVILVGGEVNNAGSIDTPQGTSLLAAGSSVRIAQLASPGLSVEISGEGNINNLGNIIAEAGSIGIVSALVKNAGTLSASSVEKDGGRVFLRASRQIDLTATSAISADGKSGGSIIAMTSENASPESRISGQLNAHGSLSARGSDGQSGGFIETSAAKLKIKENTRIDSGGGKWLLDPYDFTVAASGGDMTGSDLGTALASNDVTIATTENDATCSGASCSGGTSNGNGDIFIEDEIAWSSNQTLTLSAYRNIQINKSIEATGTNSKLALHYGQGSNDGKIAGESATYRIGENVTIKLPSGDNFQTKLGSQGTPVDYKVITALGAESNPDEYSLNAIRGNYLSGNYALGNYISASDTLNWNSEAGFAPIGDVGPYGNQTPFSGKFEGLGNTISGMIITPSDNSNNVVNAGLFGQISQSGEVRNLKIENATVTGDTAGGIAAENQGLIENVSFSGSVRGQSPVGGLVGNNDSQGQIINSSATATVSGIQLVGGIAGVNSGTIAKSLSNSQITAEDSGSYVEVENVGGVAGLNSSGTIIGTTVNISITVNGIGSAIGGIAGANEDGQIGYSTANGQIQAGSSNDIGGIVGWNEGSVYNSFYDVENFSINGGKNVFTLGRFFPVNTINGLLLIWGHSQ